MVAGRYRSDTRHHIVNPYRTGSLPTERPGDADATGSRTARLASGGSVIAAALAGPGLRSHALGMFVVTEAEAAAIRAAFDRGGELSAAVELRRLFPGVTDNAQARECARTIAAWKPLPAGIGRHSRRLRSD
jgi:hypothetical protein